MRWYVIPKITDSEDRFVPERERSAYVVNQDGRIVAMFDALVEAETAVDLYNNSVKEVA